MQNLKESSAVSGRNLHRRGAQFILYLFKCSVICTDYGKVLSRKQALPISCERAGKGSFFSSDEVIGS